MTLILLHMSVLPVGIGSTPVHASNLSQPVVGVWSDRYGTNVTDLSLIPGSEFTIKVNVTLTPSINTYEFFLNYNAFYINATKAIVKEGTFFADRCLLCFNDTGTPGVVRVSVAATGADARSGNGTLAFITFQVVGVGATALDVNRDQLLLGATSISHTTEDGLFSNTLGKPPVAVFTFAPTRPVQGDVVNFNASASKDPDGTIVSYFWRWGDDTAPITTTDPVITHVFSDRNNNAIYGTFTVTLTVTDSEGLSNRVTAQVAVTRLPFHDVLIGSLKSSLLSANPGQTVTLSVIVANGGTFDETTRLIITVGSTTIASRDVASLPSGQTRSFDIPWDTTGFTPSVYRVVANVTTVQGETNIANNSVSIFVEILAPASGASAYLILGSGIGVTAVIGALVFLLRRGKPRDES